MSSVSACILTGPTELDQVISRDLTRLLRANRAPRSLARPIALTAEAQAADWLIVICSPTTCADPALLHTIAAFRTRHGDQHMLALLTAGEPAAAFPPALLEHGEPLAADVRAPSLRRSRRLLRTESLRLLAPMLGCAFDDLRQRRRERLMRQAAAISAATLLLLTGAGLYLYARAAQTAAAAALARAETRKAEAATAAEATARARAEKGQAEAQTQTARAEEQTQEFERQQALALAQRDQSLIRQSLVLADLSRQQTALGNGLEGVRLALQGLPRPGAARPPVQQAEGALATALYSLYTATVLPWDFGPITGAVYSPDGKLIAAETAGSTVHLVEAASGRSLLTLTGSHPAFSADGTRIVTTATDGTAGIWDVATGKETVTLSGHTSTVNAATFSPDGKQVVTAGADATARVWDAESGRLLATATGHAGPVTAAVFSTKGDSIFTGSADGTVRIWTAETGAPVISLHGHQGPIMALAACRGFSADFQDLLSVAADGTARLWSTGSRKSEVTGRSAGPLLAVACSKSGRRFVTGDSAGNVRLWSTDSPWSDAPIAGLTIPDGPVVGVAFAPDGGLLTVSASGFVRHWEQTGGRTTRIMAGHTGYIGTWAFSPDGRRLATGSMDGSVRIWQLDTGIAGAVLAGHGDYVNSVAWSPDGSRLVTAGGDALVRVWDAATGRLLAETPAVKFTATAAGFAVGGGGIVTADAAGVHLWNPDTGALIDLLPPPQHLLDSYTAFSPDGRRMVLTPPWDVYSEHLTFRLFDLASRRLLAELPIDSNTAPVFSPDSARVATRQPDETIGIWDVETGRQLLHLPACKWCDIAFSPDGGRLVAGQSGGPALVYDAWTGQLLTTADGQAAGPFSADGRRVISAGGDGTIHIWDAATGVEVGMLKAPAYVHRALVTPDGRFVVGIDMNNEVIRWRYFPDMASLVNYASDLLPREEATHD